MVVLVAQQGGQCGGVGELLHLGLDFTDGEVVVVDGLYVSGEVEGAVGFPAASCASTEVIHSMVS
jgi:hypothetical protein